MTLYAFLSALAQDLLNRYRNWFLKTYSVAIVGSAITFAGIAWMYKISSFERGGPQNMAEPLFSLWVQEPEGYSYVDMSRVILFFFIAMFAIVLGRLERLPQAENAFRTLKIGVAKSLVNSEYFWTLVGIGAITALADIFLYYATNFFVTQVHTNMALMNYVDHAFTVFRIYLPPMVFTICLRHSLYAGNRRWTLRSWLFLLAGLWLMEILAHNVFIQVNNFVFSIPLFFFSNQYHFYSDHSYSYVALVVGTLLSIPLVACFFIGFASIMLTSAAFVAQFGKPPRAKHEATPEDLFTESPDT